MRWRKPFSTLISVSALFSVVAAEDDSYMKEIRDWRLEREASYRADDGWLTVAGLYWLREGENWVGAAPSNDFVLPEGSAPPVVGVFEFHDRKTRFRAEPGVAVTQDGTPVVDLELPMGSEHAITVGKLSMWVHFSGERLAIRLRDLESPLRKNFVGMDWFPVDAKYRVVGRFVPHPEPKKIEMLNILGDIEVYESTGYVDFELDERTIRVEPLTRSEGRQWLVFRDGTSGKESYPAARFLSADAPVEGKVVLDFNKAYNPPCAYNPHTTCPMPTRENRLDIRIEAGERDYEGNDS